MLTESSVTALGPCLGADAFLLIPRLNLPQLVLISVSLRNAGDSKAGRDMPTLSPEPHLPQGFYWTSCHLLVPAPPHTGGLRPSIRTASSWSVPYT